VKEIVSATIRSSKARLRSKVTGEHHSVALRAIDALGLERFHVVYEPSPPQQRFEAQFIRALRLLKYEDRDKTHSTTETGQEVIRSVQLHDDRLMVALGNSTDLAELAGTILPVAGADGCLDSGIPGVRYRSSMKGITLYLPDHEAEIVLLGVSAAAWSHAVTEAETSPNRGPTFLSRFKTVTDLELHALSPAESPSLDVPSDAESAFLRRMKAVEVLNPSMVSVWTPVLDEFHVSLWVDEFDEAGEDHLVKLLTNKRFSPKFALVKRQDHWLDFELPSGRRVVVRIQLTPTSPAADRLRDSNYR
jgi:hypothetical protein